MPSSSTNPKPNPIAQHEHEYLQNVWETEIADRRIKHKDDFQTPLEELNERHMSRFTAYEMGWYPYTF